MGLKPRRTPAATKKQPSNSGPKTVPTKASAAAFLAAIADDRRRADCETLLKMMAELSGKQAVMWGNIVGFGQYHYKYASGREGDWPRTGFASRKTSLTIYCMPGYKAQGDLLAKLGPHKHSVSCLYIKRLEQVDLGVLRQIVKRSLEQMARMYPGN